MPSVCRDSVSTRAASFCSSSRSPRRRGLGEEARGFGLERLPHDVVPAHVLFGGNPHARAGARAALEQALELEAQERLRDGQQAHPELPGEGAPRNRLADRQLALQDPLTEDHVGFAGKAVLSVLHKGPIRPRR